MRRLGVFLILFCSTLASAGERERRAQFRASLPAHLRSAVRFFPRCSTRLELAALASVNPNAVNYFVPAEFRGAFDKYLKDEFVRPLRAAGAAGNTTLETRLLELLLPGAIRFLRNYFERDRHDTHFIADVAQHASANLLLAIRSGNYDPDKPNRLTTYFQRILINEMHNARRERGNARRTGLQVAEAEGPSALDVEEAIAPHGDTWAMLREVAPTIASICSWALTPTETVVLRMALVENLDPEEIARARGKTPESVRQHLQNIAFKIVEAANQPPYDYFPHFAPSLEALRHLYELTPALFREALAPEATRD